MKQIKISLRPTELYEKAEKICELVDSISSSAAEAYAVIRFTQMIYEDTMSEMGLTKQCKTDLDRIVKQILKMANV